jgi:predicted nucleic acid-binding protein
LADTVIDSSVVAKWVLPESDSAAAQRLISEAAANGDRLIVLDLAFPEVANAIWKRCHRGLVTLDEARRLLNALLAAPVHVEPAAPLLPAAFDIATRYDRAVYDALFVALTQQTGLRGVTADEPLHNAVHADFPKVLLLRDV